MILAKDIAMYTKRPMFEILEWPESELDWWAAFFSIDRNKERPTVKVIKKHVTVKQSIEDMKAVLSR